MYQPSLFPSSPEDQLITWFHTWLRQARVFNNRLTESPPGRSPSPRTTLTYQAMWGALVRDTAGEFTPSKLSEFFGKLASDNSRLRYLALLEVVIPSLLQNSLLARDPLPELITRLSAAKETKTLLRCLSPQETEQIADVLTLPAPKWKRHRDRAAAALALYAGLKPSEILALRQDDVLGATDQIRVPGNRLRPERIVTLLPKGKGVLQNWLAIRGNLAPGRLLLPADAQGRPVAASTLWRQTMCVFHTAQVEESGGLQALRNTNAILRLRAAHSLAEVGIALGLERLDSAKALVTAATAAGWDLPDG